MDSKYVSRIEALKAVWCDAEVVETLYGLDLADQELQGKFRAWGPRLNKTGEVLRPGPLVNRHALENFFQFAKMLPLKWAAARLGMTADSLESVLAKLAQAELIDGRFLDTNTQPQLIEEGIIKGFYRYFNALNSRIFGSHDDFCRRLHAAIQQEFGLDVVALRCVTALRLYGNPAEADYAYEFDVITDQPIGLRYQVWLDFGKPMNLHPDACSTLFYTQNRPQLQPFLLRGSEPDVPAPLLQAT